MLMKILLLGHKGYLGSYLFHEMNADILEHRNVYNNGKEYDYIINCIGKTSIEYCENNIYESNYSNYIIIRDILQYYPNAKLINFSSYYVYDDKCPCNEESKTTSKYMYTCQKLKAEKLNKNGVTFRLGKIFGNPYAEPNKLVGYIMKNQDLVLDSVLFNPTSCKQILKIINYEISEKNMVGVYNLSNLGFTSPYELGIFINDVLHTKKNIKKIKKMKRSFHNYGNFLMDTSKLNSIYPLTEWKEDLEEYLKNYVC